MSSPKNDFQGVNEGYVLEMYDRWRQDPQSVDQATRGVFSTWTQDPRTPGPQDPRTPGPQDPGTPGPHLDLPHVSRGARAEGRRLSQVRHGAGAGNSGRACSLGGVDMSDAPGSRRARTRPVSYLRHGA